MVKFYENPKLKNPVLVASWPGMGYVALRAARYLKDTLGAKHFADIDPFSYFHPTSVVVSKGLVENPRFPKNSFYFWKNKKRGGRDIILFLGDAQPAVEKEYEFSSIVLDVANKYGTKTVFTFAAMPAAIDHTAPPGIWCTTTSQSLNENLKRYNVKFMREGQISGMNGLLLGVSKERGLEGYCLLGELPYYTIQIENPRSSMAVLRTFSKIVDIDIDFRALEIQSVEIEQELEKFVQYLRQSQGTKPITEEEITKIKTYWGQKGDIPQKVYDKIERLFKEAEKDITRAKELKDELDRWNLYQKYEDRFLNLFRKGHH